MLPGQRPSAQSDRSPGCISLICGLSHTSGLSRRSIMHRHPEAARCLRRAVVRPLMQEGVLMYCRAAQWVDAQRTLGCAVLQCVPGKAQLGGDFITDRRLHR